MLERLKRLFAGEASPAEREAHDLPTAVAALMIEVMMQDGRLDAEEERVIHHLLGKRFALDDAAIRDLVARARAQTDRAHDLFQFTARIIRGYPVAERADVIRELWRVAMADGRADAYEEQLIRRIAELIGVEHRAFIEAKIQARGESA